MAAQAAPASAPPSCGAARGVGKTTIARLLADGSGMAFEPVSATFFGVAEPLQITGGKWIDLPYEWCGSYLRMVSPSTYLRLGKEQ
ncbi:hypothetical protein ABZT45_21085 [Streptomyces sp. NPDC005356]|uniref:hypothetical protein n=1 Tax=Streptomyces sp. NPDC005356 TaxID=3157167 RepID=UPI0033A03FC5